MHAYNFLFSCCIDLKDRALKLDNFNEKNIQHNKNKHLIRGKFPSYYDEVSYTDNDSDTTDLTDSEDELLTMSPKIDPRNDSDDDLENLNTNNTNNTKILYVCSIKVQNDFNVKNEYLKMNNKTNNKCDVYQLINKMLSKLNELKFQMNGLLQESDMIKKMSYERNNEAIIMTASNPEFIAQWIDTPWLLNYDASISFLGETKISEELGIIMNYNKMECEQIDFYEFNGIIFCEIICVRKGYIWNNRFRINMWPNQLKLCIKKIS